MSLTTTIRLSEKIKEALSERKLNLNQPFDEVIKGLIKNRDEKEGKSC